MTSVLVVDDEAAMRAALEANFVRQGWRVQTAARKVEALALFRSAPCPLVVTDMRMPDGDGLEVVRGVRAISPQTAVVLLTAFANVSDAVAAMKEGAADYLIKPVSFEELKEIAERVIGRPGEEKDRPSVRPGADELIGDSPRFRALVEGVRQSARTDADILIEAESGTGKEVLARFIHKSSGRCGGPFVPVNCAAFPETLLESELFGHVRGAFTGATTTKPGKFELADGGILLLDEIGEMPLSLQPKLLRVLQEREVDRLGDTRAVRVDVRVIATTNCRLGDLVRQGRFRSDLYYRINVIPMSLPPLRERREDIARLVRFFVGKYCRDGGGSAPQLTSDLLARIEAYDWPGNVRELENFVRRALALSTGPVVGVEVLEGTEFTPTSAVPQRLEAGLTLREMERQLLESTLAATGGNRTRAAGILGISIRTIRNKIREYGLPPREVA
jgi:DNA-binding NtrC family response regulator